MDYKKFLNFCYGCEVTHLSGTVIISPFLSSNLFKRYFENVNPFTGRLFSGFISPGIGNSFIFIKTGLGDRLTGDAVMLLRDTGVSRIVFIGACGGFGNCDIGDIVLVRRAFDGEGFSRYYKNSFNMEKIHNEGSYIEADQKFTDEFKDFLKNKAEKDKKIIEGDIFTIGSLLAETNENLLSIEKKGFCGVDMELSAVFQAAETIKKPVIAATVVSDLPLRRPLGEDFSSGEGKAYDKSMKNLVEKIVEFTKKH